MQTQNPIQIESMKWRKILSRITLGLFCATVLVETVVSLILYFQGLIEQTIPIYILKYYIRPIVISLIIILVGRWHYMRKQSDEAFYRTNVIMITLMFGNSVYIHNIFLVAFFIFCIPIFLTVILQDKWLLKVTFILSELFVLAIAIHSIAENSSVYTQGFYIPSIVIVMATLLVCYLIAKTSINLLIQKNVMLVEAMESAQAASKSKSQFLSSVSHEIRTPINAILGMDEMIIRESTDSQITDYARDIKNSGATLLGLINDVLDFSKIEAGKINIIPVEYESTMLINDLINSTAHRASDKGLELKTDITPSVPTSLYGDEIRIRQVALNILSNAVKYTEKGTVTLKINSAKVDDNHVKISTSVIDTGKGIKPEDIDKLFAPFERIDEKANRTIEGTGLGMSITKNLLALMNSKLEVTSEWGKGSTFSFEIIQEVRDWTPIGDYATNYRKSMSKTGGYTPSFTAPEARILVVDDVSMNLKVINGLLKKTEIKIDTALSGAECLNLAKSRQYDAIFIDHMMPEMDGIETLRTLNEDEGGPNFITKKIAFTANAIAGSKEFYMNAGFYDYLSKPVDPIKLEAMLKQILPPNKINLT